MKTAIIPSKPIFYGERTDLDLKAICAYAALGFFLDRDTFWSGQKTLPLASDCQIDENGALIAAKPYFEWHYQPRNISLNKAVEEFAQLFEKILADQIMGRKTILPLSGGLDSRTQAAGLKELGADVEGYSYSFEGGHDETRYSRKIAQIEQFPFHGWSVKRGYLWDMLDDLAVINGCYSEFTHPRQMAFRNRYRALGDVFSLGHWGDVLFDDMSVEDKLPLHDQLQVVLKKMLKKGGTELGTALWQAWGIDGDFKDYLYERIGALLRAIDIRESANARLRAFKSIYWAPRWTSVNLSIYESVRPLTLPYYDNRMCEFICTVPEKHLAGRKIQIAYLKRRAPRLAKVTWQDHRPFNLLNYEWDRPPWNLPLRTYDKLKRTLTRSGLIQRNWELQFLGSENDEKLRSRLFDEVKLSEWIPIRLIQDFYNRFTREDPVYYSHSISMLLTLSLFARHHKN